jgi:Lipocalin-like domain
MKTQLRIFAILFISLLTFSCNNDDDNNSGTPVVDDLIGTWQYKSVSGSFTSPAGTFPMVCTNTMGTITLNANQSYIMSNVNSECQSGKLALPLAIATNSGTYTRNNTSLVTNPTSGTVFNMTIEELTNNRMKLRLVQTISASVTTNVVYTLEK